MRGVDLSVEVCENLLRREILARRCVRGGFLPESPTFEASSSFGIPRAGEKRMDRHPSNDLPPCSPRKSDNRGRHGLTRYAQKAWRHLPILLFIAAISIASFASGALVVRYRLFPYSIISDGLKTLQTLREPGRVHGGKFGGWFAGVRPESAAVNRIQFLDGDSLSEPVLWYGGRFQFIELCPEWGCLAVEFTAAGEVAHAYPLHLDALERAASEATADEFPFELAPTFSFARDVHPIGMSQFPNGDLLVVFHTDYTASPYGAGIARIDRAGHPVWFRRDYSHHWPRIEEDGSVLVPGMSIGNESVSFPIEGTGLTARIDCGSGRPYLDTVNVIDGDGRLLESIDLMSALIDSPFAAALQYTSHSCDPIHLNFVDRIGEDTGGAWGMSPGDLVVSMRNLSAFAILDGDSGRVKRFVRGSFFQQHSVRHLGGTRFLMFDNHGTDGVYGPSRLLMVDIANGRETTIFPNDSTPESLGDLFSLFHSKIDISPDRRRVMVVFTQMGVAVEVRLRDGVALNVFRSLHDVSSFEQFSDERATRSAVFKMYGLDYIRDQDGARQ